MHQTCVHTCADQCGYACTRRPREAVYHPPSRRQAFGVCDSRTTGSTRISCKSPPVQIPPATRCIQSARMVSVVLTNHGTSMTAGGDGEQQQRPDRDAYEFASLRPTRMSTLAHAIDHEHYQQTAQAGKPEHAIFRAQQQPRDSIARRIPRQA